MLHGSPAVSRRGARTGLSLLPVSPYTEVDVRPHTTKDSHCMGVLRNSGRTRLTLSVTRPAEAQDAILEAVRETAAGEYEVFGEIGRSSDGTTAYLARDRHDGKLVALRLSRGPSPGNEYLLEV